VRDAPQARSISESPSYRDAAAQGRRRRAGSGRVREVRVPLLYPKDDGDDDDDDEALIMLIQRIMESKKAIAIVLQGTFSVFDY
jgi:hypothetical protein